MKLENRSVDKNQRERNYMKISQLVGQSGVNKTTIHYYLNLGLLPEPLRTGLNLQLYDQTHLAYLKEIKRLREQENLSLREIKEILKNKDWHSISTDSMPSNSSQLLNNSRKKERC